MNPEWIVAICAGVSLLILWTTTAIGAVVWLNRQFKLVKKEILEDFDAKHKDNETVVKAMEELVMRHDLILEPEFNGSGRSHYMAKQRTRQ